MTRKNENQEMYYVMRLNFCNAKNIAEISAH